MGEFKYLHDEQHYIDRYDLSTIRKCFKVIDMFQDFYKKSLTSEEMKNISKNDNYSDTTKIMYWHLWFIQAQEYKNKKETIKKWMDKDKLKQDKQDYTPVPQGIRCPLCKSSMYFNSSNHLEYSFSRRQELCICLICHTYLSRLTTNYCFANDTSIITSYLEALDIP